MGDASDPKMHAHESPEPDVVVVERRPIRWAVPVLLFTLAVLLLVLLLMLRLPQDSLPGPTGSPGLEAVSILSGPGTGDLPQFKRPLSAAYGPDGEMYVSDTGNARICVFGRMGRYDREFGRNIPGQPAGKKGTTLLQPAGLAVDEDGTVYVTDLKRGAVMVFDSEGTYRDTFSIRKGWRPVDVAVSGEMLAVADESGVTLLSKQGEQAGQFTEAGGVPFARPNGVAFTLPETLAVSDTNNARVVSMGIDGTTRWVYGGGPNAAKPVGLPRGIAVAPDGTVVFADAFRFALVRLSDDGTQLASYGARGRSPALFEYPNDVDLREDLGLVADKDNNRVQVVRFVDE